MTFTRLSRADVVASVAALLLLLVLAMDWYSTDKGEELRRDAKLTEPGIVGGGEFEPTLKEERESAAEKEEKNAWQADAAVDRLVLIALLGAAFAALVAAFLRAADRRFEPSLTPSAVATWLGIAAALLVAYRIVQPPGINEGAVVKLGAVLGLLTVGVLAVASRIAARAEAAAPPEGAAPPEDTAAELAPPVGEPVRPATE